jgi:hypothetical protein
MPCGESYEMQTVHVLNACGIVVMMGGACGVDVPLVVTCDVTDVELKCITLVCTSLLMYHVQIFHILYTLHKKRGGAWRGCKPAQASRGVLRNIEQGLTLHSTLSYRKAIVRYSAGTTDVLGSFAVENSVPYVMLSCRKAIVRVFWCIKA